MSHLQGNLERGAGILLPISALPGPYGIGTFGKSAYEFVDQLVMAGQSYWQVLPIGPTSFGDSPYQSFSAFAGNPYFIDLDLLVEDGFLMESDLSEIDWGSCAYSINYHLMYENRYRILKKAFLNFQNLDSEVARERRLDYAQFLEREEEWVEDYALFMAIKDHFQGRSWQEWEEDIKHRSPKALEYYKGLLKEQMEFYCYLQYEFYRQWTLLKRYANKKSVSIIGDIPIYVALDSADVWVNPGQFQLKEDLTPIEVAGCPPDAG